MPKTQTTINPAPERKYHSVCPKCKGALTPVPSGSICLACADTLIFAPLEPVDERLSKRMVDNAAYPLATRTGLQLSPDEKKALAGDGHPREAVCRGDDVYAIDGMAGLFGRAYANDKGKPGTVQARSDNHYLWVFWRWGETKVLLDAVERVLDAQAADAAESVGADTSPEYVGKEEDPLSSGEKP